MLFHNETEWNDGTYIVADDLMNSFHSYSVKAEKIDGNGIVSELVDLTPFTNGKDWWNNDPTNAILLLPVDCYRFNQLCLESHIDMFLNNMVGYKYND